MMKIKEVKTLQFISISFVEQKYLRCVFCIHLRLLHCIESTTKKLKQLTKPSELERTKMPNTDSPEPSEKSHSTSSCIFYKEFFNYLSEESVDMNNHDKNHRNHQEYHSTST